MNHNMLNAEFLFLYPVVFKNESLIEIILLYLSVIIIPSGIFSMMWADNLNFFPSSTDFLLFLIKLLNFLYYL
jgi:hypothetical protein